METHIDQIHTFEIYNLQNQYTHVLNNRQPKKLVSIGIMTSGLAKPQQIISSDIEFHY